jgi:NAD(P)-dependent dehydrogenase (short-subunit alcohol dehydrogenase family)
LRTKQTFTKKRSKERGLARNGSRAVVVTGTSTGIGASITSLLARAGFTVFAGVRSDADARLVEAREGDIRAVRLDVTDRSAIQNAAQLVAASEIPLAGLVNNAGIAIAGPLEFLPLGDLREQFEINVFGPLAVTQAFLPQLRTQRGRIVFIGSVSGRIAMPFMAPYSSSKFALRAIADALRVEVAPAGVRVCLVEPGSVKTPIWRKGRDANEKIQQRLGAVGASHYGDPFQSVVQQTEREEQTGLAPERVSRAVLHALTARRPRTHYVLGAPARLGILLSWLPAELHDRIVRASLRL